ELAIVKTAMARLSERARSRATGPKELAIELGRLNRTLDRHLAQMQSGILEVRMVPLGQAFDKLARVVRQISREHGKDVNLVVTGAETEIDKLIVEELSDPLMHMIRNAIDHGIESGDERMRVGKPPVGTIALNAFQKGNHVVIEVEDDGAGMDPKAIIATAVRKGVLSSYEANDMTPREVLALVFMPGFTTKEGATDLSGRGVGLDVVKTNTGKLGGAGDITSEVGIGTKMTITLPITLAIINVLLVEIGKHLFAVPLASVEEAFALDPAQVRTVESREVLSVRGVSLPLCRLDRLFALERTAPMPSKAFVVIAQVAQRRLGFVVDELIGQSDIVSKPLGKSLKSVRGFAGATELGVQRVALVLDVAVLIEEVLTPGEARYLVQAEGGRAQMPAAQARPRPGSRAARRSREAGTRTEYLAFALGGETYAVPIAQLPEILKPPPITDVPRAPSPVLGVISVRGKLVTVIDLRRRLRLAEAPTDRRTRILLVESGGGEQMGLLVDEVHQVWRLAHEEIEAPGVLGGEQAVHIAGIGRPAGVDGAVLILLDLRPIVEGTRDG